jgi:hypothetical protein
LIIAVFWNMTPCNLVEYCQSFGETCWYPKAPWDKYWKNLINVRWHSTKLYGVPPQKTSQPPAYEFEISFWKFCVIIMNYTTSGTVTRLWSGRPQNRGSIANMGMADSGIHSAFYLMRTYVPMAFPRG